MTKQEFLEKFNLTEKDLKKLENLQKAYGMMKGPEKYRSEGNDFFLSNILIYYKPMYELSSNSMTHQLKTILKRDYPQLTNT